MLQDHPTSVPERRTGWAISRNKTKCWTNSGSCCQLLVVSLPWKRVRFVATKGRKNPLYASVPAWKDGDCSYHFERTRYFYRHPVSAEKRGAFVRVGGRRWRYQRAGWRNQPVSLPGHFAVVASGAYAGVPFVLLPSGDQFDQDRGSQVSVSAWQNT